VVGCLTSDPKIAGLNPGQAVIEYQVTTLGKLFSHTHAPLSPSNIIWYGPNHWESNSSMYVRGIAYRPHNRAVSAAHCRLKAIGNGDKHRTLGSQNCERAKLTAGAFTLRVQAPSSTHLTNNAASHDTEH